MSTPAKKSQKSAPAKAKPPAKKEPIPKPKTPNQPSQGGRPSKFSEAILETIIEKLSDGVPLRKICRDDETMPSWRTVYRWMEDESVSSRIARARELGYDSLAEESIAIADDTSKDFIERERQDGRIEVVSDTEHIQRSKLRIETRLKLLAKWFPKKYGDKLEVKGDLKFIPLNELAPQVAAEPEDE